MTTYRLPAEWGGALIKATYRGMDMGRHLYDGVQEGVGGYRLGFANKLEEIRPPSIDDPVELPLTLEDPDGDTLSIDEPQNGYRGRGKAIVWQPTSSGGAVLNAEQCRDAARALWLLGTREQS